MDDNFVFLPWLLVWVSPQLSLALSVFVDGSDDNDVVVAAVSDAVVGKSGNCHFSPLKLGKVCIR